MKLSSLAKDHVKDEVKKAFAADLKAAEDDLTNAKAEAQVRWTKFSEEFDEMLEPMNDKLQKLVKKHKLTPCGRGCGTDFSKYSVGLRLSLCHDDSWYGSVDKGNFVETSESRCQEVRDAENKLYDVKDQITKACNKALYEIEVNGKKSTLETIVEEVIREIKEGK